MVPVYIKSGTDHSVVGGSGTISLFPRSDNKYIIVYHNPSSDLFAYPKCSFLDELPCTADVDIITIDDERDIRDFLLQEYYAYFGETNND